MSVLVPRERIEQTILLIRGHRVMLSTVLADLYAVEPRVLNQAVKRNRERFPADFMFQLTEQEFDHLKSQIVISSWGGLRRAYPRELPPEFRLPRVTYNRSHHERGDDEDTEAAIHIRV
jgi:hypothetical protein